MGCLEGWQEGLFEGWLVGELIALELKINDQTVNTNTNEENLISKMSGLGNPLYTSIRI